MLEICYWETEAFCHIFKNVTEVKLSGELNLDLFVKNQNQENMDDEKKCPKKKTAKSLETLEKNSPIIVALKPF